MIENLILQFGDAVRHCLAEWIWLMLPAGLMLAGIYRRITSPIPSRKPKFGRD